MLDVQYIRENPQLVATKSKQKGYAVDIPRFLELDQHYTTLKRDADEKRRQINEHAARFKAVKGVPAQEDIQKGKGLKAELADIEHRLKSVEQEYTNFLKQIPNMPLADVPVGATEEENQIAKTWGNIEKKEFAAKPHWELLESRDMLDKERAAKISGSRFAYLKGDLVRLQFAIVQFVMQTLGDEKVIKHLIEENKLEIDSTPFVPVVPPALLRTEPYAASARLNAEEVTYRLADDDLWLNASAEHTLCTMYWNEILSGDELPIRYIGYSTSFRREAGTYGKDTEGIIRMHQFDKLEMEVFSAPEKGLEEHLLLVAIQEYLVQQLGLPYRLLQKCTFDIGKPNARGIDIECWFPGQQRYIETHTADFMTDYQARDLKIRVRSAEGEVALVHTNDATAFALGRTMAAIVENYQTADGHIGVPGALVPFMSGKRLL